jgi:hypothetical protein
VFRKLLAASGVGAGSAVRPRVHDYADLRVMPTSARLSLWHKESRPMRLA